MKLFFWIFTFIFLIIGNVNSEEAFKCKTDLRSADNDEENALRLQMCWNELNSKSEKTQKYFLKPGIYVFIYNGNENLYLAADDNAAVAQVEEDPQAAASDSSPSVGRTRKRIQFVSSSSVSGGSPALLRAT